MCSPTPKPRARLSVSPLAALTAAVVLVVAAGSGGAVAGALITGKQIKDESVTGADIRNGSLSAQELSPAATVELRGLVASGAVSSSGKISLVRAARGVTVRAGRLSLGRYCIRVDGVRASTIDTVMTASADSSFNDTAANSDSGYQAFVEVAAGGPPDEGNGCGTQAWTVATYRQQGASVIKADESFTFQIG